MSSSSQALERSQTSKPYGLIPKAKTVTSHVKRVMTAPAEPTYGHRQVVSAYRLKWGILEEFLRQRFPEKEYPGLKFEKTLVIQELRSMIVDCTTDNRVLVDQRSLHCHAT